ncbi:unnamed protein product [Heligmosomoides polygyrus]|uniref:DUF5641 domain-containing protein n=1 Tax=Heligmosomoides polygyrus TaxID=6339 RepID=A0A183GVZ5_HELPZ|nr:unnamed protein product [Heligmosomoides polygyrus]
MIALFKSAFCKTVGKSLLSLEALQTTIVEIEAVINSRPLTPFRESDVFAHILKPIDFTSPEVNIQLPPVSQLPDQHQDVSHRLVDWYKDTTKVLDSFWDIWHSDYLAALRERQQIPHRQKRSATKTPKEGDIVLMADDKLPRGQWPLGVLMKICYGQDNVARSATVRTSAGRQLIRSLAHLYPLEISAPDASDSPGSDSSSTLPPKRVQPSRAAKTAHKVVKSGSL